MLNLSDQVLALFKLEYSNESYEEVKYEYEETIEEGLYDL